MVETMKEKIISIIKSYEDEISDGFSWHCDEDRALGEIADKIILYMDQFLDMHNHR